MEVVKCKTEDRSSLSAYLKEVSLLPSFCKLNIHIDLRADILKRQERWINKRDKNGNISLFGRFYYIFLGIYFHLCKSFDNV